MFEDDRVATLTVVMSAAILFPVGLFWLAWTSSPSFHLWIPMMAGLPFGIGLLAIFQGSMQYMIDAYGPFASSAVSRLPLPCLSIRPQHRARRVQLEATAKGEYSADDSSLGQH